MNWIDIVILLVQLVIVGCMIFYKRHIEETVKTLHMRDQSYENKMGDYDALKESLDTILKEVEHMKSGVAFEEQRRHHWIESRNQKLINLIRYSQIINTGKAKLMIALNNQSRSELEKLQSDISSAILDVRVDQLTLLATNPELNNNSITLFVDAVFKLGNEVLTRISNAISLLESSEKMLNNAFSISNDEQKLPWLAMAQANKNQLVEMKNNTVYTCDEGFEEKETQYMIYLRQLFEEGTLLKN